MLKFIEDWNTDFPTLSMEPSIDTYNNVIEAHVKNPGPTAARDAEAILYRLLNEDSFENKFRQPNAKTFGLVIQLWVRSKEEGSAERAEQLLLRCERAFEKGNFRAEPNVVTYTQVVRSCHPFQHAWEVLTVFTIDRWLG